MNILFCNVTEACKSFPTNFELHMFVRFQIRICPSLSLKRTSNYRTVISPDGAVSPPPPGGGVKASSPASTPYGSRQSETIITIKAFLDKKGRNKEKAIKGLLFLDVHNPLLSRIYIHARTYVYNVHTKIVLL